MLSLVESDTPLTAEGTHNNNVDPSRHPFFDMANENFGGAMPERFHFVHPCGNR